MTAATKLTLGSVLDYYDGPLLFTAKDALWNWYLSVFLETTEAGSEYVRVRVSEERLNEFMVGHRDLKSMYSHPEADEFYTLITNTADEFLEAKPVESRDLKTHLLPRSGYYIQQRE